MNYWEGPFLGIKSYTNIDLRKMYYFYFHIAYNLTDEVVGSLLYVPQQANYSVNSSWPCWVFLALIVL